MVHEPEVALATLVDGLHGPTPVAVVIPISGFHCVVKRTPTVATPNHQCSLSDSPQTQRISNGARARVCYGNPRRWTAWAYSCAVMAMAISGTSCVANHQCSLSDSPQTQRISNGARARVAMATLADGLHGSYACSNGYVQSGSSCVRS